LVSIEIIVFSVPEIVDMWVKPMLDLAVVLEGLSLTEECAVFVVAIGHTDIPVQDRHRRFMVTRLFDVNKELGAIHIRASDYYAGFEGDIAVEIRARKA